MIGKPSHLIESPGGTGETGLPERRPALTRPDVYLHAGQIFVSAEPHAVMTILGSCVSVCLWDPGRRIGGLNHFLLPYWAEGGQKSPRFGNVAVKVLIDKLEELGCRKRSLRGKVFGGSQVLGPETPKEHHLGAKNVDLALAILEQEKIQVVAKDVGGPRGRKLIFHVADGAAWIKKI